MNILMASILIIFLLASLLSVLNKQEKSIHKFSVLLAIFGSAAVFYLTVPVLLGWVLPGWTNLIFLDRFSALMASLVAGVYLMATIVSTRYIGHEYRDGQISQADVRLYYALLHLFALCMLITVLTNNTLVLWIALEGTTLSSTFLVGLYKKKTSVEAAWKYIVICSTGISLGLIGILLLGFGVNSVGVSNSEMFLLTSLIKYAPLIQPSIAKFAFVFIFVGFGAKVGLVPMHFWLPDAHSKAPSPISALFSGILLNVALYAIIRFTFIINGTLQYVWTSNFFLFFGLLSVAVSAMMMLVQNNYKRMLAYSSIEHMGLITLALGLPPIGTIAAIIHMIGHTLTKSLLFFGAGEILIRWKTTTIEKVRGVYAADPYTAILFLFGLLAIIAMPPSILFISEYSIFTSALTQYPALSIMLFILLSIIAYAMLKLTISLLFFNEDQTVTEKPKASGWNLTHSVMLFQALMIVGLGFWFTTPSGQMLVGNIAKDIIYTFPK